MPVEPKFNFVPVTFKGVVLHIHEVFQIFYPYDPKR